MKTKYLIYNLTFNTYFLDCDPDPIFGNLDECPYLFDDKQKALKKLIELFNTNLDKKLFEIKKVYYI